ncbi:hypothetical protein JCM9157_4788 [Halalkalibacter akibai JCM 9157]|uniref:Uncharacterized protein n=2 Tax=Halalkalibacter akibai TaxID=1411 RepID=W4R1S6_HALA3|nr:hypothetical protein JCM9157_4788 [Halalkalibacter akibai JCM 9157]
MKMKILAVIGLLSVALAVFVFSTNNEGDLTKEMDVENIKELVQDFSLGNIQSQSASITSHQLIVTDSSASKVTFDLPEEEFFVSIAPYVENTHT